MMAAAITLTRLTAETALLYRDHCTTVYSTVLLKLWSYSRHVFFAASQTILRPHIVQQNVEFVKFHKVSCPLWSSVKFRNFSPIVQFVRNKMLHSNWVQMYRFLNAGSAPAAPQSLQRVYRGIQGSDFNLRSWKQESPADARVTCDSAIVPRWPPATILDFIEPQIAPSIRRPWKP